MKTLKIYDPALCCSSGVCGPSPDEKLVKLAAFLKGLDKKVCRVERFNLAQQPEAYTANQEVAGALKEKGADVLPLIFIDDELVFSEEYPAIKDLATRLNIAIIEVPGKSCSCKGNCC